MQLTLVLDRSLCRIQGRWRARGAREIRVFFQVSYPSIGLAWASDVGQNLPINSVETEDIVIVIVVEPGKVVDVETG